ncbi:MAG: hypothetical protein R6V50_08215 [Thermoplasmatota archaeon]
MKDLRNSDEAVVGIVVTVLLIGLALSVVIMINTAFVPQWLEEAEAAHMEEVSSQFSQLKYATDLQATLRQRTAISSSIRLGISNLPILSSGKTFGSLGISENECDISIEHETGFLNFTVGNIKFSSGNSYFVRQDYILESGALIVAQHPNSMLMGKPLFLAGYAEPPFDGRITFTVINTTTSLDKSFVSGHSTYPIHTEFITSDPYPNLNLSKITVISDYPNAWQAVFESTLKRSDNPYNADLVSVSGNMVLVDFNEYEGSGSTVCDIRYVEILAQIAPGWIE